MYQNSQTQLLSIVEKLISFCRHHHRGDCHSSSSSFLDSAAAVDVVVPVFVVVPDDSSSPRHIHPKFSRTPTPSTDPASLPSAWAAMCNPARCGCGTAP